MAIEWLAEHLRVSLFSSAAVQITEEDWRAVTGQSEAETRQAIVGGRVFSGRYDSGVLNLSGANSRIDIVLAPLVATDLAAEPQFPSVGPWEVMHEKFLKFTHTWIESTKFPIIRIAFGAVLNHPTAERNAAYDLLKGMVTTVRVDPDRMRELSYRVNWRTESSVVRGMTINRITNWSAVLIVVSHIPLQPPPSVAPSSIPSLHGARLEIDNSTDAARTEPFQPKQLIPILKELISYASETAQKGDPT
jgi:hypothetical protein